MVGCFLLFPISIFSSFSSLTLTLTPNNLYQRKGMTWSTPIPTSSKPYWTNFTSCTSKVRSILFTIHCSMLFIPSNISMYVPVKKPREQVADAEALLDFTRTLVGSVKSLVNEGITPSHFVSSLLKYYHQPSFNWQKLGLAVSPFFPTVVNGSSTMYVTLLITTSLLANHYYIPFILTLLSTFKAWSNGKSTQATQSTRPREKKCWPYYNC